MLRYADLPQARTARQDRTGDEWRCRFHVPIFLESAGDCGTTRPFLEAILLRLPADLRRASVTESTILEIRWLEGRLHG